jgi:hypothetical protein
LQQISPGVKRAILVTLNLLLELVPQLLRGFVPQFQTVFSRSLQDVDASVRDQAAVAMGRLTGLITQLDPLVNELCSGVQSSAAKVRHSLLLALTGTILHAGGKNKISDKGMDRIVDTLAHLRSDPACNADEKTRELTASAIGAFGSVCSPIALESILRSAVKGCTSGEENVRDVNFQSLCCLASGLSYGPALDKFSDSVLPLLAESTKDNSHLVRRSVIKALVAWLYVNLRSCEENVPEIIKACMSALAPEDREARVEVMKLLKRFFKLHPTAATPEVLTILVPPVLERALDKKSFPVKLAAERLLVKALRIKVDKQVAVTYLKSVQSAEQQKELQGYFVRVLMKLPEDSSDEETTG